MGGVAVTAVGSNDIRKAMAFYDELLAVIGLGTAMEHPSGGRMYGSGFGSTMFCVLPPFDGQPATIGNGSMVSFACDSPGQATAMHAKALSLGGKDEGAPGQRGGEDSPIFAAYFRDLDGNKICAFHYAQ
ncbi:MAG: VOC family protein [Sphingomonadaceae bacterium]